MLSVLLSVYNEEKASYLEDALVSIWDEQTLKPTQVVLVQDGPLTAELDAVIEVWQAKLGDILVTVPLPENIGLAAALNEGLKHCTHEYIARMDADDISMAERFEKQYAFMQSNPEIAVSSGLVEEWAEDFSYMFFERRLPLKHKEIFKFAKHRSPISHPAVIYRKSAVLAVGGYPKNYPEDYLLWCRMLVKGYTFANLPELILKMRTGDAFYKRRGCQFLKGEIQVYKYLLNIGFITRYEFLTNCFLRGVVRLSPSYIKKYFYKYLR